MAISEVSPEGVAIPELGVAPLVDSETDLEYELPTPDDYLFMSDSSPEGVCLPGVCPAPPDVIDFELEKALLNVSMLPVMVTPIVDPLWFLPGAPSSYLEPPLHVLPNDDPTPISLISPLRGWPIVRSWMYFHPTSCHPLAPYMSRTPPR